MKTCVIGLLISALVAGTGQGGQDQEPPFRIGVNVDSVVIDAIVQDRSGRYLTDLKQGDFEILENGVPQDMDYFASTDAARSILLLFDFSGSTDSHVPFMSDALKFLFARMRPTDRLALASFGTKFQMMMDWRTVGDKPLNVPEADSQAGSELFKATELAIETFANEKDRKAIIIMTDGRDSSMFNDVVRLRRVESIQSDQRFQKHLAIVKKHSIPLYFIALNTDKNRDANAPAIEYRYISEALGRTTAEQYLTAVRLRMEHLADATGGRILFPQTLADVAPLYDTIGRDLGYSYSLGYTSKSPSDGKARRIEVRARRSGLKVTQSRESYTP
jgi:VWFA-related protein